MSDSLGPGSIGATAINISRMGMKHLPCRVVVDAEKLMHRLELRGFNDSCANEHDWHEDEEDEVDVARHVVASISVDHPDWL
jgi:hypothetical protein